MDEEAESWLADFKKSLSAQIGDLTGDALRAYNELDFYADYVMAHGNIEYAKSPKMLRDIYHLFQYSDEDLLILGPRNSAKSTAVTVTGSSWEIGRNPLIRYLLAFASMDVQGAAFGRQIDTIIDKNDRYKEIFGALKPSQPDRWTATEKIVIRPEPPSGLKDPTISIVGLGTAVPSKRADRIVCDDLVTQENAFSEILRRRVIRFVYMTLFPILVPGGRRFILGSRWDSQDLYAETASKWGLSFPKTETIKVDEILRNIVEAGLVDKALAGDVAQDLDVAMQVAPDQLIDTTKIGQERLAAVLEAMVSGKPALRDLINEAPTIYPGARPPSQLTLDATGKRSRNWELAS